MDENKVFNFIVATLKRVGLYFVAFILVGWTLQRLQYGFVISLAIASLLTYFAFDRIRWSIGLKANKIIYDFTKGLISGLLAILSVFTIIYFFGGHKIVGITLDGFAILTWTISCLIVAMSEEILVRGYIYGFLRYKFGAISSSIISSGLFAAFHLARPGISALTISTLFLAGVLYTYLREKSGSIWLPIGFHFAWNYISGILGVWRGELILIETNLTSSSMVHGGTYGIEGSLVTVLFFLIVTATVYIRNKRLFNNPYEKVI